MVDQASHRGGDDRHGAGLRLQGDEGQARVFTAHVRSSISVALLYLLFYVGMGMQMTWLFFWGSLGAAIAGGLWASHLLNRYEGSGRAVFVTVGMLSFLTVCLGGYVREASRPRFVSPSGTEEAGFDRIQQYSDIYYPAERPENLKIRMVRGTPSYVAELPQRTPLVRLSPETTAADLVSSYCISCHTLERVYRYKGSDWDRVVGRMNAYDPRLTGEEMSKIVEYLESGELQRNTSFDPNEAPASPL